VPDLQRPRLASREAQLRVRIPPGTESGAERVVEHQGEPGQFGGPPGHLRVTINVRPHPWLRRDGADIHGDAFVSVTEAARGGRVPVPTLTGPVDRRDPARRGQRHQAAAARQGRAGSVGQARRSDRHRDRRDPAGDRGPLADALEALERAVQADPQALPKRSAQRG
jgi:molecular chaperone DnaJ